MKETHEKRKYALKITRASDFSMQRVAGGMGEHGRTGADMITVMT